MGKLIALIVIAAAAFWIYNNVDFANFTTNATNTFKKEKTIRGVDETRRQNNEASERALEGF